MCETTTQQTNNNGKHKTQQTPHNKTKQMGQPQIRN